MNTIFSQSLVPLISRPTRITDSSATLIDNIFLSSPSNLKAGTIVADISDHFPIFVLIRSMFSVPQISDSHRSIFRMINDDNLQKFGDRLAGLDCDAELGDCDANAAPGRLNDLLMSHFDVCCLSLIHI